MKLVFCSIIVLISTLQAGAQGYRERSTVSFHSQNKEMVQASSSSFFALANPQWKFKTGGKIFSTPAIQRDRVFIGSEDGFLYCLNAQTGKLQWKFKTGGAIHSSPAIFNNIVCFGSFDGTYYALDFETGLLRWKFSTEGEKKMGDTAYWGMKPAGMYMEDPWDCFLSSPVVSESSNNQVVYFGSSDGNLYAVNTNNGSLRWKFKANGSIHSSPLVNNERIYFGSWDTYFYALDAQTGQLIWKFGTGTNTGMAGIQASATIDSGVVYFGARDAHLYALNAANGNLVWKYDAGNAWIVGSAVIHHDVLLAGTSDSYLLLALDKKTGEEKFRFKTNGYVFGTPAIYNNTVYFGDFTGKMYAVDLASAGQRWNSLSTSARKKYASTVLKNDSLNYAHAARYKDLSFYENNIKAMDALYSLGSIVSSPRVYKGLLFFGSADGYVYAINLKEKKQGS